MRKIILIICLCLVAIMSNAETFKSKFGFTYQLPDDKWFSLSETFSRLAINEISEFDYPELLTEQIIKVLKSGEVELLYNKKDIILGNNFVNNITVVQVDMNYEMMEQSALQDLSKLITLYMKSKFEFYERESLTISGKDALMLSYADLGRGNYHNVLYIKVSNNYPIQITYTTRERVTKLLSDFKYMAETIKF